MRHFLKATNTKGASNFGILIIALILALAAWLLLPRYFFQLEKNQSLSMQAMLVNIAIAEESYFAKHQAYTDNWQELISLVAQPATLEITGKPLPPSSSDYFFGFGRKGTHHSNGFIVTLRLMPDGASGIITAARSGSVRHRYDLIRPFPQGQTGCLAESETSSEFCDQFLQTVEIFEVKNLVPVNKEPVPEE